jgi:hypothetical protein
MGKTNRLRKGGEYCIRTNRRQRQIDRKRRKRERERQQVMISACDLHMREIG